MIGVKAMKWTKSTPLKVLERTLLAIFLVEVSIKFKENDRFFKSN